MTPARSSARPPRDEELPGERPTPAPDAAFSWRRGSLSSGHPSVTLIFTSGAASKLGENALLAGRAAYLARHLLHRSER
jgi:hypothetical protein